MLKNGILKLAIKHIYGQGPVYIRTWYCLNSKLVQSAEILFPPQMMTWTVKTMKKKVVNVATGNFSHLKDLIIEKLVLLKLILF